MCVRESRNPRASGFGGIAFRLISDPYIALFSHFIPCGVWEAVYILDSPLANSSDLSPRLPRGGHRVLLRAAFAARPACRRVRAGCLRPR